nr:MAG TPA: hypothetical protein [Caudoviricetes sp.]
MLNTRFLLFHTLRETCLKTLGRFWSLLTILNGV